jgi:hypothetical protein
VDSRQPWLRPLCAIWRRCAPALTCGIAPEDGFAKDSCASLATTPGAQFDQKRISPPIESLEYRTEVKQLLDILAHSLYTDREIFLRELISNASDALNRVQFEMLTNHDVVDADAELAIHDHG